MHFMMRNVKPNEQSYEKDAPRERASKTSLARPNDVMMRLVSTQDESAVSEARGAMVSEHLTCFERFKRRLLHV
jgi:hypothetical protein